MPTPPHSNPLASEKTLRDEFAMAAIAGLLACPSLKGLPERFSELSYEYADAMLAERAKSQPEQTSTPDDDGWIEWHGGECPVDPEVLVHVKFRNGRVDYGRHAGGWYWRQRGLPADILFYRPVQS